MMMRLLPTTLSKRAPSSLSSSSASGGGAGSSTSRQQQSSRYLLIFKVILFVLLGLRLKISSNSNRWDQVLIAANTRVHTRQTSRSVQQVSLDYEEPRPQQQQHQNDAGAETTARSSSAIILNPSDQQQQQPLVKSANKNMIATTRVQRVIDENKMEESSKDGRRTSYKKNSIETPDATRPRERQRGRAPVRAVVDRTKRQQRQRRRQKQRQTSRRPAYWEVAYKLVIQRKDQNSYPSYRNAKVLRGGNSSGNNTATTTTSGSSSNSKMISCRETCCVETVAISLNQDEYKPINTNDAQDLADILISFDWDYDQHHLKYHGVNFHMEMIPCLLPGTIFQIDNQYENLDYFWQMVRPHITVPYVIITTQSDRDSPLLHEDDIQDPLLLKWYGTNPVSRPNSKAFTNYSLEKFRPLSLGLSYQHPQEKNLLPYLALTNYTNPFPFAKKQHRWDWNKFNFNFDRDVFIHFGRRRPHRRILWERLCLPNRNGNNNNNNSSSTTATPPKNDRVVSCNNETTKMPIQQIYKEMSQYRFGVSPPGMGWDCYRTYEMLLLGVIPIIQKRSPWSEIMFDGLPVIQIDKLDRSTTRKSIKRAIRQYVTSPTFLNATFDSEEEGWNKLFFKYRRQQLLRDAKRDDDIFVDKATGIEYYQAYKYSVRRSNTKKHPPNNDLHDEEDILCKNKQTPKKSCWVETDKNKLIDWRSNPLPNNVNDKTQQEAWLLEWTENLKWK